MDSDASTQDPGRGEDVRVEMSGLVEGSLIQIGRLTITLPAGPEAPLPQELPPAVLGFVGRAGELMQLNDSISNVKPPHSPLLIISGMPGVGKTALAVIWAHSTVENYPDGHLFVDLHGYDIGPRVEAIDTLGAFLRVLGVKGSEIPETIEDRARLYRSLLADKRMLIVLDNAAESEQVRPLLASSRGSVTIVTSRDSMTPLVVREGARRILLTPLTNSDATALVREMVGGEREVSDPELDELIQIAGNLPLTLRIASVSIATRSSEPVRNLLDELSNTQTRLKLFSEEEDPRVALDSVFSWSYNQLTVATAYTFRLLASHPGAAYDKYTTAALLGAKTEVASACLRDLARANLLERADNSRFQLHDLLKLYAQELLVMDKEEARNSATRRLLDHYIEATKLASKLSGLKVLESQARPSIAAELFGDPQRFTEQDDTQKWLEVERSAIMALLSRPIAPEDKIDLSAGILRHLQISGHFRDATLAAGAALEAARSIGDAKAEAGLLYELARTQFTWGHLAEASELANKAIDAARGISDVSLEGDALNVLGVIQWRQGEYSGALASYHAAMKSLSAAKDRGGEGAVLLNIGLISERTGDYETAYDTLQHALRMLREVGDKYGELVAFDAIGLIQQRRGEYEEARRSFEGSLRLAEEVRDRAREAGALDDLGVVATAQGLFGDALVYHTKAIAICEEIDYPAGLAEASGNLGSALLGLQRPAEAMEYFDAAVRLANDLGDLRLQAASLCGYGRSQAEEGNIQDGLSVLERARMLSVSISDVLEQARALDNIGDVHILAGHPLLAHHAWTAAADLYEQLSVPQETNVRNKLSELRMS